MQVIQGNPILVYDDNNEDIVNSSSPYVRSAGLPISTTEGHKVNSYVELLKKIATLSYYNSRFRLLFRGQSIDYKFNMSGEPGSHSCLYPAILRPEAGKKKEDLLDERFEILKEAEELLIQELRVADIRRDQIIRWAILQHYEVCKTPLLDLTQSIQTALSFALNNNEGYLFVFAFPQLTGAVSVSIESMTQVIDLSQVCPPEALRPHFQKGLLASDYPAVTSRMASHGKKGMIGNNFSCRLLTKFKLNNCSSWEKEGFTLTPNEILFPNSPDKWYDITQKIKFIVSP